MAKRRQAVNLESLADAFLAAAESGNVQQLASLRKAAEEIAATGKTAEEVAKSVFPSAVGGLMPSATFESDTEVRVSVDISESSGRQQTFTPYIDMRAGETASNLTSKVIEWTKAHMGKAGTIAAEGSVSITFGVMFVRGAISGMIATQTLESPTQTESQHREE